jgi:hypothetical protein
MKQHKKSDNQLELIPQENRHPDSNTSPSADSKPTKPRIVSKAAAVTPAALQPSLPGLSRRGRPRVQNPVSPTVRASESRKRRVEAGTKRVELLLAPEIAANLDTLTKHFNVSRVEIVSKLIAKAAKRIK